MAQAGAKDSWRESASGVIEITDSDSDDKPSETPRPPLRARMEAMTERHLHRPLVPKTVKMMKLLEWQQGIRNLMSADAMRAAGTGLACLDKGMAQKHGLRVIRRVVRNKKGVLEDPVLLANSPVLHAFLKTLMEREDLQNVALQQMTAQRYHCDPHARSAPVGELHLLLTVLGDDHCFGLSTSEQVTELDHRYRTWACSNGSKGCAAVKFQEEDLRDVFLVPRAGNRPLQAVEQPLLAGRDFDFETPAGGLALKRIVALHAGVPGSRESQSLGAFWKSSREMQDLRKSRQEKFNNEGVEVSVTLLANFLGTPAEAALAVEYAAELAWNAHVLNHGSMEESHNKSVIVHRRDLLEFEKMEGGGEICSLLKGHQDYWTPERKDAHALKSAQGGGCKAGKMEGEDKDAHVLKSEQGGASKAGKMEGADKQNHGALTSQAAEDRRLRVLNIANSVAESTEKWSCKSVANGSGVALHFHSDDKSREPIIGLGNFEDFIVNDNNGFGTKMLTPAGSHALKTLKNKKRQAEKDRARKNAKKACGAAGAAAKP